MSFPLPDGNGKLAYWLLGIVGTLLTGRTTGWITFIQALPASTARRSPA